MTQQPDPDAGRPQGAGALAAAPPQLAEVVARVAGQLGATAIVELGTASGILAQLASAPGGGKRRYVGVDIAPGPLEAARRHAQALGVASIDWIEGDALEPAGWMNALAGEKRVMYFSCHFHRFVDGGTAPLLRALQALTSVSATGGFLVLQRPEHAGVAHNLRGPQWQQLLGEGGCTDVWVESTASAGCSAYVGAVLEGSYV
jgi:hypothetical protein